MALLRVSDILQISGRSGPREVLKVHKLQSKVSKLEWMVHDAVTLDVRIYHDDPEAIEIISVPPTGKIDFCGRRNGSVGLNRA